MSHLVSTEMMRTKTIMVMSDDSHNSDGVEVGGDDVGDDNGGGDGDEDNMGIDGGDEITEEQELLQQIQELSLEGQVEHLDESDSDKKYTSMYTNAFYSTVGTHWQKSRARGRGVGGWG